jgi:hypothetical protein
MDPNSANHARGNCFTNAADLMGKLVEIERAVESVGLTSVHKILLEAEEAVLQFEEHMIKTLFENQRLRESMENGTERFSAPECSDSVAFAELPGLFVSDRARREFGPFSNN